MAKSSRLFVVVLSVPFLFLFFLYLAARPPLSALFSASQPDEIYGLLHFVTSPYEADRVITTPPAAAAADVGAPTWSDAIEPDKPVNLTWYAKSDPLARPWASRVRDLHEQYPLVVFSKTYCPYSKKAKKLLEAYDLTPPPKIVEVDMRADAPHLKTLLTRLTHRSTFPNVLLRGLSLGGWDELNALHEKGMLQRKLEESGVRVGRPGKL